MSLMQLIARREAEQAAFEAQLDELLTAHLGQYAVFEGGRPMGFFDSYGDAFEFGLALYGTERVFLVARVEDPPWRLVGIEVAALMRPVDRHAGAVLGGGRVVDAADAERQGESPPSESSPSASARAYR